jgi:hypothetical protein
VAKQRFTLHAKVATDSPGPIRHALWGLLGQEAVEQGGKPGEFMVTKSMVGESAKDLNRQLLSALRRVEKKTRLRAEWKAKDGTVSRFFDYVLKEESRP